MAKLVQVIVEAHAKEPVDERFLEAAIGGAIRRVSQIVTVEAVNVAVEEDEPAALRNGSADLTDEELAALDAILPVPE